MSDNLNEKIVYQLSKEHNYWSASKFIPYPKSQMHLLYMSFNEQNYWISMNIIDNQIIIWDSFDQEHADGENISKLSISKGNYEQIVKEWNKNIENPAKYLIFYRDDNGWISLNAKDELSADDLHQIELDRLAKIEHEQKWNKPN